MKAVIVDEGWIGAVIEVVDFDLPRCVYNGKVLFRSDISSVESYARGLSKAGWAVGTVSFDAKSGFLDYYASFGRNKRPNGSASRVHFFSKKEVRRCEAVITELVLKTTDSVLGWEKGHRNSNKTKLKAEIIEYLNDLHTIIKDISTTSDPYLEAAIVLERRKTELKALEEQIRVKARKEMAIELRKSRARRNSMRSNLKALTQEKQKLEDVLNSMQRQIQGSSIKIEKLKNIGEQLEKENSNCQFHVFQDVPCNFLVPSKEGEGLPNTSGVYFIWENSKVVYVGQSVNLARRVRLGTHENIAEGDLVSFFEIELNQLYWAESFYIGVLAPQRNFVGQRERHLDLLKKIRPEIYPTTGLGDSWCRFYLYLPINTPINANEG